MAAVVTLPEQRVILRDVSWATYEALVIDHANCSAPRFTFNQGVLEIMSPFVEHEECNRVLADIVGVYAEEMGINFRHSGSTTFRREEWGYGFEPDSSFYIQNERYIKGKAQIDPNVDPPPDLVIEIDISRHSLDKLPLYARFGVPEVWRYDGEGIGIYKLAGDGYVESKDSVVLPGLTAAGLSRFLKEGRSVERIVWLRKLREWIRGRKGR
jgi:Uma2 family endonuclease